MTNNPARYAWYVVGMLWMISFFNYADRQALSSVFPLLEKDLGLTKVELGLLGSAFAWVYGLAAPLAGLVVDKFRRKGAILAGLHVWSFICMATALSTNFFGLYVFRALEGLGESIYFPASMSMLSDYHGKATRSRAMGLHQTSVYVGSIAGGFFAGLIGQYYGWRWAFIVFGGLGMLLGFALHWILREPKRGAADKADLGVEEAPPASLTLPQFLKTVWTTPSAMLLMAAFMCANFVAWVLLTWMPKYLTDSFGMSLAMSGLTATMYVQLASMCSAPLGGWLADLLRKRTPQGRMIVQAIGVLGGAPFVALCGLTHSVPMLLLALTCWGFFKGLYDANIFAALFEVIRPEARGVGAGFMNSTGWLLGAAPAPVIIALISESRGLGPAIAMASFMYLAAFGLLLIAILFTVKSDNARMQAELAGRR